MIAAGVALAAALAVRADAAQTSEPPAWLGGQVYEENDSLLAGDDRYTQGLRFTMVRSKAPTWAQSANEWLVSKIYRDRLDFQPRLSVVFGQNMYTPEIITAPDPYPGDRGFSGLLYGGIQLAFTEVGQRERHTLEATVGVMGSGSLAEQAQAGLHVLRFNRIPKGWDQARDRPAGNLYYRYERRVAACSASRCYADVTGGFLGAAGNIQTAAGLHAAARLGWSLTGFPAAVIPDAAAPMRRGRIEVGAIVGWEGRLVGYNGLLVPTPGTASFTRRSAVGDFRYGGYLRFKDVRATVLGVDRSPEYEVAGAEPRSQSFASVSLSYEPMGHGDAKLERWLLRDWRFELGLGGTPIGSGFYGSRHGGPAGRIGLAKGFAGGFTVGFQMDGSVVADRPSPSLPDTHNDTFQILRVVALGWETPIRQARIGVRAGPSLFKQVLKVQTVDNHLESGKPVEDLSASYLTGGRWGWVASVEAWHPLESHTYFGASLTYAHPKWDQPLASSDFVTFLVGVQIRP